MSQFDNVESKFLIVNGLARRAIQVENSARRRLEFENRNALTRAIEELEQGIIEIQAGGPVEQKVEPSL